MTDRERGDRTETLVALRELARRLRLADEDWAADELEQIVSRAAQGETPPRSPMRLDKLTENCPTCEGWGKVPAEPPARAAAPQEEMAIVLDAARQHHRNDAVWRNVPGEAYFSANLARSENRRRLGEAIEALKAAPQESPTPAAEGQSDLPTLQPTRLDLGL